MKKEAEDRKRSIRVKRIWDNNYEIQGKSNTIRGGRRKIIKEEKEEE